jgi:mRNA interferase HicA
VKRRELIRHLEAHGCPMKREGGSHTIYWNQKLGVETRQAAAKRAAEYLKEQGAGDLYRR